MKIAQISSIYLSIPPKTHGGTERVVFDLCQHLTKRGHQVELFASGDSKDAAVVATDSAADKRDAVIAIGSPSPRCKSLLPFRVVHKV